MNEWECAHGHQYTPDNTYLAKDGSKRCRACNNEQQKQRRVRDQKQTRTTNRAKTVAGPPPKPVAISTWREDAACATVAVDLWFPEASQSGVAARAKAICATCPVRALCLQEGLNEIHGVWGGTTPQERKALRRHNRATA